MQFTHTPNRPIDIDGKEHRISRSAVISVVLFFFNLTDQTRYLPLCKRGKAVDESGKHCLPCGYLDRDETAAEAMRREVWEETGLDISDLMRRYPWQGDMQQPFHVDSNPRSHKQNVMLEYFLSFEVDTLPAVSTDNADQDEVESTIWLPVTKACKIEMAFSHEMIIRERRERTQRNLGK
ncbi:MAG: NUDIX hydrolase [bacterium]|nr:NUDIX hydrolase [bacterium]